MFVKICGLRSEEHVQVAVDAGADAVGFVFADSARKVSPTHAADIANKVPVFIKKVAVMLHPSNEDWQKVLHGFAPDVLQTDVQDLARLDIPADIECWPVHREENTVTGTVRTVALNRVTGTYLFEGARSGRGEKVDWAKAAELAATGNMILAGGLGIDNVADAIATVRPFGVDVSSGVETAPGEKDSQKIRAFINAAKAAGNSL